MYISLNKITTTTTITGADPGFGNGGGGPRFVGKRVTYTSEVSYERSEYKSAGGTEIFFEFRTPESESEPNLTNYFIIFLLLFY